MEAIWGFISKFFTLDLLTSLVRFGIVLGVLIFVHELGHFLIAKWRGIYVKVFSLGFGPRLVGFRKNETDYRISAFPLGGYVKMAGQEDWPGQEEKEKEETEEDKDIPQERKFSGKRTWEKLSVIAAGPLMNILAAVFIFTALYSVGFQVPSYYLSTRIGEVLDGSPAAEAGLRPGDLIEEIDSTPVRDWEAVVMAMIFSWGEPRRLTVRSGDGVKNVEVSPVHLPGSRFRGIGIAPYLEAEVKGLLPGMPAEAAGLKPGDVILSLNGKEYSSPELIEEISRLPGHPGSLQVRREGKIIPISLPIAAAGTVPGVVLDGSRVIYAEKAEGNGPSPLQAGDRIVAVNGTRVEPEEVGSFIRDHPDEMLVLRVERPAGEEADKSIFETAITTGTRGMLGVEIGIHQVEEHYPIFRAFARAVRKTIGQAKAWILSLVALGRGEISHRELAGPIGIYLATEKVAKEGMVELLQFVATISIILGLVNLLPIPVLDGGNLLIFSLEGIRRKPLKVKTMVVLQQIGLIIVALIAVLVFYNDIFYRLLGH